jgi:hemoglobin
LAFQEINDETIGKLVSEFYGKVRLDAELGPIFAQHIGDDWVPHLEIISLFWSNVMLADGRYSGNPMGKHMGLKEVQPHHFEIWLGLFRETAQDLFEEPVASRFIERAERIAQSIQIGMFQSFGPKVTTAT